METQTNQSPGTQSSLTLQDGTQLDPGVVKVMRTIRKIESQDKYDAVGDSGASYGAYQWNNDNVPLKPGQLPSHWKNAAQQYLGDGNAPMTPANQNKVAYQQILAYKQAGRQPEEIDALWNGAKKDPTTNKFVHLNQQRAQQFREALLGGTQQPNQTGQFVNPNAHQQPNNSFVQPPPQITPDVSVPSQQLETPPKPVNQVDPNIPGSKPWDTMGLLRKMESPFLGVAAIPTQGLASLLGQSDPFQKGIGSDLVQGGNKAPGDVTPLVDPLTNKITAKTIEQKAGDAAQVGSYMVPGSGVLSAAGMGALQGAGASMSKGEGITDVLQQGALGAAVGGGTALAAKGIGYGLGKAGDFISGEGHTKAIRGIKDAYSSALNLNASERAFEGRSGKDLAQVLLDNQAPLSKYENGTLDASAAIQKLQEALDPLNAEATKVLSSPQGVVKDVVLTDVLGQVKSRIQSLPISQAEKNMAVKQAEKLLMAEAQQYGDAVTPEVADRIKQGLWGTTFKRNVTSGDALRGNVSYLTGNTLKTEIEKAVAGTDAGNVLPALNAQRSDLVDAIKRLIKLDGVRGIRGGRVGNIAGGLVGTIIGSQTGGVLGGLAGDYFGTKAASFLNNPATKLAIAKARANVAGKVPGLLGRAAKPVGNAIANTGAGISKMARPAGLLGNLLAK